MRRIALVCDWYHPRRGGIETHLGELATRLMARGHSVHVITSTPGPDELNGVRVHRLAVPRLPVAGVAATLPVRAIQEILVREQIDVVHSHVSIVAPVALAGGIAAHRAGIPSVLTFHSFIPALSLCATLVGRLLGASRWRALMTGVSQRVIRDVRSFAPGSTFSLLPNAIDGSFWQPADRAPGAEVRLVYAGRLQAKKHPLLLLSILRELARSDAPWHLTVVGEGPLERRLRDGVSRLGVDDRVTFAGWTERSSLRDILRNSDIFLSTAARESFGLAALEARSTGLALVAVRDSAVADFVEHDRSGLLAGNDREFVAATLRLVNDAALRARITAFNREHGVSYGWDEALRRHEDAYAAAERLLRAER